MNTFTVDLRGARLLEPRLLEQRLQEQSDHYQDGDGAPGADSRA